MAYVIYVIAPELWYGTADPGPDVLLAMVMVVTHSMAGMSTLLLLLVRGPHWRTAEFWVLLIYWAGIAGWLTPGIAAGSIWIDPTIPWLCTRISAVAVVLMPTVALARSMSRIGRRRHEVG